MIEIRNALGVLIGYRDSEGKLHVAQSRKPGRQTPYITIVDNGLCIAIQNWLVSYSIAIEHDDPSFMPAPELAGELADLLRNEMETRTF